MPFGQGRRPVSFIVLLVMLALAVGVPGWVSAQVDAPAASPVAPTDPDRVPTDGPAPAPERQLAPAACTAPRVTLGMSSSDSSITQIGPNSTFQLTGPKSTGLLYFRDSTQLPQNFSSPWLWDLPCGTYTLAINAGSQFEPFVRTYEITADTKSLPVVLTPRADVNAGYFTFAITSCAPAVDNTLPPGTAWKVTNASGVVMDSGAGLPTYFPQSLSAPQFYNAAYPYGTYTLTITPPSEFAPFSQTYTLGQPYQSESLCLQPLAAMPTVTPTTPSTATATTVPTDPATPTETSTATATTEPTADATPTETSTATATTVPTNQATTTPSVDETPTVGATVESTATAPVESTATAPSGGSTNPTVVVNPGSDQRTPSSGSSADSGGTASRKVTSTGQRTSSGTTRTAAGGSSGSVKTLPSTGSAPDHRQPFAILIGLAATASGLAMVLRLRRHAAR